MAMDIPKLRDKLNGNFAGRFFLWAVSLAYGLAVFLRNRLYDSGVLKQKTVHSRVVCLGNITAGGTGKTSAVMLAARTLAEAGIKTAIVSRGYKRQSQNKEPVVLSDKTSASWNEAGDEPYMLCEALREHNVPVVVCADRVIAAQTAVRLFKSQVILMDDGFQHRRLSRDKDIVLLDARRPFGSGGLLPYGTLREQKSALRRADLAVLTHADMAENLDETKTEIRKINRRLEILESVHEPEYFFDVSKSEKLPLDGLAGEAASLSAIGDPESFEKTLKKLGLRLKQIWRYPDHHPYTLDELRSAYTLCSGMPLVTTYKDFVKFPEGWRDVVSGGVYFLSIRMKILGGGDEFDAWADALYPRLSLRLRQKPSPVSE